MNILAEKQKWVNEAGIDDKEREKRWNEFLELYYSLRNKEEQKWYSRLTLKQRHFLHPLILLVYKIKNKFGKFTYEVLKDERVKTDKAIIFAVTHVGKFDIEVTSEAIKDHYYLLSGDYEHIQGIVDAPFLALNGVIYFNEKVKDDRKSAVSRMIEHLKSGGNLLYFPEGTWNLSPNLPTLPLYWGIVDIAKQGDATIVPVAAEQYEKHFKINIGKNFEITQDADKTSAISELRDIFTKLKWEIWETEKSTLKLSYEYWNDYKKERYAEWPYFNDDYIIDLIFKPKNVTSYDEAFFHLSEIVPNHNTAFLFNKRIN